MKSEIPPEFAGFDLYRYRRATAWQKPKAEPTAQECVDSCWANMQTAAAEMARARVIYDRLNPGDVGLLFALGEVNRLRAEAAHWRGLMEYHRARIRVRDPRLPREPGEDDE